MQRLTDDDPYGINFLTRSCQLYNTLIIAYNCSPIPWAIDHKQDIQSQNNCWWEDSNPWPNAPYCCAKLIDNANKASMKGGSNHAAINENTWCLQLIPPLRFPYCDNDNFFRSDAHVESDKVICTQSTSQHHWRPIWMHHWGRGVASNPHKKTITNFFLNCVISLKSSAPK